MKSTDLLRKDHTHLLDALHILGEMAALAERSQIVDQKDVEELLSFLKGFGDRHHQGKEESVLFPALLNDRAQKNYHALCALVFQHNRERSLVEGLWESMATKHTKDFVFLATRLNEILRSHIKEEEEVLFPLVDASLSRVEDVSVASEMQAYDKVWQETQLSAQLGKLGDLKAKYLGTSTPPPALPNVKETGAFLL